MIEVFTVSGLRKLVSISNIVSVNELSDRTDSKAVIVLTTGEPLFVADSYDDIKAQILCTGGN